LTAPLSFGLDPAADVHAVDVRHTARGSSFTVVSPTATWRQELRILGGFNVSNALGAAAAALALGLDAPTIAAALASCAGAPGRVEPVDAGQPFAVLVDYAHTPDAVEKVIGAVRPVTEGRLITVFGCGGDRDRTKRPQMGSIASSGSDLAVVTSDNPRTEPPQRIIDDIVEGIADSDRDRVVVEADRHAAIGRAIGEARPGDVVLILGKGHEDYQILGEQKVHFDDREVARVWLQHRG
jgi:UDP-N-acetylmuramoyl-L-alanyl-D-glutamate--2,6-diaminopimelate ligase